MIPRSHRLSTEQFNEVIKKGRIYHSTLFLMRMTQGNVGLAHIAAAVPVKVGKTAVSRNAMRRKTYEALQPLLLKIKEGLNIILLAKTIHAPLTQAPASMSALKANVDKPASKPANKPAPKKLLTVAAVADDLKALFVKAAILR